MATTGPSLYPGATTFPNTNVYPGQGSYPFVRFMYATDDLSVLSPTWIDGTSKLRTFNVSRGRDSEMSQFNTGSLTADLDNRTRAFAPDSGTYGTVVYGTGVYGQPQVAPMNRVLLYAEWSGQTYPLFTGYAEAWQQAWPDPGTSDSIVTLSAADEFKVLALAVLPTVGQIPAGWNIDQINMILDTINSRAPRRTYRGLNIVTDSAVRDMTGQDPLSEIIASGDTAITHGTFYAFFVADDGYVTFVPSGLAGPTFGFYQTSQFTFDEYPVGGSEHGYLDVTTDFSDAFLTNQWTVTRPGGTAQTATAAGSVSRYGLRALSRNTPFASDAHALLAAQLLVAKTSTPAVRVTGLTPDMSDGDTTAAVFALDLFVQLDVNRTPPGGVQQTQTVRVQKINLSGAGGTSREGTIVDCSLGLAPR